MENGEIFTSLEEITAEAKAKAKAEKQRVEEAQLGGPKLTAADIRAANKAGEVHFKAQHGIVVAFFSFILVLHILGIYLFTSGFLLTRLVLPHKSECAVPPIDLTKGYVAGDAEKGCWHPKTYNKAIVVIIDALRYDFTVPFEAQFESVNLDKQADRVQAASSEKNIAPRYFHNAIPVFYETARKQPNNAFLLPFIADPPTTTLQRLKGLTTGTLPTFIDAGSNFAGTAIDEDNMIAQLKDAGKRVVHLGDDTWHALFPGYFEPNLTHAYDSFNVWDLHTVDNGVTEHIFPLLKAENSSKWDVIFGHYLGVDHAGHRYGPDHPAMAAKLNELDAVFRRMIEEIDNDTLLVVMGDHGMDAKGDHGGESDDEIQAALWMYSKRGDFGRTDPSFVLPPAHAKDRSVAQIDLVPTLSLLLGMPIPFNNLGKPIDEAFASTKGDGYENLATVNRLAGAQIHRYQGEYAKARGLDESTFATSLSLWPTAEEAWTSAFQRTSFGGGTAKGERMKAAYKAFGSYQHETLRICRSLWARFDIPRMVNGVLILALSMLLIALYARGLIGDRAEITPVFFTRGLLGTVLGALLGFAASLVSPDIPKEHAIIFAAAMTGITGVLSAFFAFRDRLGSLLPNNIWGWTSVIFTVSLSAGFAANSFTIWEDEILLHFLTTFGLLSVVSSFRQKSMSDRTLGVYHSILFTVLLRVASFSRLCREEQMPYCKSTYYASALSTTSAPWQLFIPAVAALLVPTLIKSYYEGTKNYHNMAVMWIGIVLRFGLMVSAVYWILDAADDGDWYPGLSSIIKITKQALALGVLFLALAGGHVLYNWSKALLNVETVNEGTPQKQVIIHGYANAHGSLYAIIITIWYLAVALLQKPMGAGAISILVWQLFSLFEIVDTNNLRQSPIGPVVLGLLGSFHYFKTGHQATLSSIQWESAFIPLRSIRYPWTPIIIILNTFGAHIICAVAVPALVLWKAQPKQRRLLSTVAKAIATHILFYSVVNLATTMWVGHLRRHLMLYRIFSPRFMLGASVLLVVDVFAIFVGLWGARMSTLSVAEVFGFA